MSMLVNVVGVMWSGFRVTGLKMASVARMLDRALEQRQISLMLELLVSFISPLNYYTLYQMP